MKVPLLPRIRRRACALFAILRHPTSVLCLFAFLCLPLRAQTSLYWDGNGATAGAGTTPTGTWGTGSFWSDSPLGNVTTSGWIAGRSAVFSAGSDGTGAYTVTVSGTQNLGPSLGVLRGNPTITGGTLNLTQTNTSFDIASNTTIASALTGTGVTLTKTGTGFLTLSGANTFTGTLSLAGGFLDLNGSAATWGGNLSMVSGTALTLRPDTAAYATPTRTDMTLSGSGLVFVSGLNTPWLALNTVSHGFSGTINVQSGAGLMSWSGLTMNGAQLSLNAGGKFSVANTAVNLGSLSGAGDVFQGWDSSSRTLTVGANNQSTNFSGVIHGDGSTSNQGGFETGVLSLTKTGTGTQILSGANTYAGTTTISGGTLQIGNGGASGTLGTGAVVNNAALAFNRSDAVAVASAISGTGTVTQSGSGTLSLTGANTYTGPTVVSSGILSVSSLANGGVASGIGAASSSASNLVLAGGTLRYTGAAVTSDRGFSVGTSGGTLDASGTGALTLSYSGLLGSNLESGSRTLTLTGTGTGSLAAQISQGPGTTTSITKTGSGTWTLSGNNDYTGATTISGGTLKFGSNTALGNSPVSIASGATLDVNGRAASVPSVSGAGAVALGTNGSLTVGADNASSAFSGAISGSGGTFTKTGTGTLTFSGSNDNAMSNLVVNNGTLTLDRSAGYYGVGYLVGGSGLANGGTLTVAPTATVNVNGHYQFDGNAGNALDSRGSVQVTLNGGKLNFGAGSLENALGAVTMNNGGTVTIGSGHWVDLNNSGNITTTGTGAPTISGGGQLNLLQRNTSGTMSTFNIGATAPLTISTAIGSPVVGTSAGGLGLNKAGSGTLTLTGSNSYSGPTVINGGTLAVSGGASLSDSSQVSLADVAGAALVLSSNETIGSLAGGGANGGDLTLGAATLTTGGDNTSTMFSGRINLTSGSIVKSGTGNFTLAGTTDNVGLTATVNGGTLVLGKPSSNTVHAVGTAGTGLTVNSGGTAQLAGTGNDQIYRQASVTLSSGGTLDLNGRNEGFNGLTGGGTVTNSATGTVSTLTLGEDNGTFAFDGIVRNGAGTTALTKNGSGTLTLNGANSYSGATAINSGTVIAGAPGALSGSSAVTLADAAGVNLTITSNQTIGSLSGGGTAGGDVALSGSTLTLGGDNTSTRFDGRLNVTDGALIKSGNGTFTLAGAGDSQSLTATVNGGTLELARPSSTSVHALGSAGTALTINTGGTARLAGTGDDQITNPSTVVVNSGGTFDLNGRNEGFNSLTGGGVVTNSATGTTGRLTLGESGGGSTFAGRLLDGANGAGKTALTKTGSGSLTLSGNNSFTGGTRLDGGTLVLGSFGALGSSGEIRFGGGTLQFTANNTTDYSARIANSTSPISVDTSDRTVRFGNVLDQTNTGGLTVSGNNELQLTADNTFIGNVTINSGASVRVGNNTSTGTLGSGPITDNGNLVFHRNNDLNVSARISGSRFSLRSRCLQGAG